MLLLGYTVLWEAEKPVIEDAKFFLISPMIPHRFVKMTTGFGSTCLLAMIITAWCLSKDGCGFERL